MKKVKGIIISIGLVIALCGCGAEALNDEVSKELEMTIVKDELVSTSDKVVEEKESVEKETVLVEDKTEELSEDRESIQIEKETNNEVTVDTIAVEENPLYMDGMVTQDDLVIQIRDVLVRTGDNINMYLEQLGTPDDFVQARSCLYDGDDKVYTFGGIIIYTYPNGADDIVYLIEVTGGEKLLSGIGIGSAKSDVIAAYGEEYVEFGTMLAYDLSETASLSFQIENDVVTFIEIYNE